MVYNNYNQDKYKMGQQPQQGPQKPEPTMKGTSSLISRTSQIVHYANQPNPPWAAEIKV